MTYLSWSALCLASSPLQGFAGSGKKETAKQHSGFFLLFPLQQELRSTRDLFSGLEQEQCNQMLYQCITRLWLSSLQKSELQIFVFPPPPLSQQCTLNAVSTTFQVSNSLSLRMRFSSCSKSWNTWRFIFSCKKKSTVRQGQELPKVNRDRSLLSFCSNIPIAGNFPH